MRKMLFILMIASIALMGIGQVAAQEATTLSFGTFVDAHVDFYESRVDAWNEANPDRLIELDPSVAPFDQYHDRLLVSLLSGSGAPDLADIEISKFGTFTQGDIQLLDLGDMVTDTENLLEARLSPYQAGGAQYGIPTHVGTWVMYYNQEIMDEVGVDPAEITTWDRFIEVGQEVTADTDGDGEIDRWMTAVETTDRFSALGLMLMNGGGIYDAEGNLILDSEANAEALQLLGDLVNVHEIARPADGGQFNESPAFFDAMNSGQYAAIWMPQWYVLRFEAVMPDLEGHIVVRPMPVFESTGYTSAMGGGTGTAITAQIDPEKEQLARDFLQFAKLTYDANIAIWEVFDLDPFRTDVYEDEALTQPRPYFNNEPIMQTVAEVQANMAPAYTGPQYPDAVNLLRQQVIFAVVEDGVPAAEALAAAAEQLQ